MTAATRPEAAQKMGTEETKDPSVDAGQEENDRLCPVHQKGHCWPLPGEVLGRVGKQSSTGPLSILTDSGDGEASYGHFSVSMCHPPLCVWGKVLVFSMDGGEEDISPAGLHGRIA